MSKLTCENTGIVYRNPYPNIRSIHAYKPSIVILPNGELLTSFQLGEAFQAVNLHINLARSTDGGKSWNLEEPIFPRNESESVSYEGRLSFINGEVIAFLIGNKRTRENYGPNNPQTKGYNEMDLIIVRSKDGAKTWNKPKIINTPMKVPYEMCCPVTVLRDGRWIIPTSIWRNWDGSHPYGLKMIALVSYDSGYTWDEYFDVMVDPQNNIIYWESKILQLRDGRLLAVAWGYDQKNGVDLPNQYAISDDGGKTFSNPASTGLFGQTLTPLQLDDGKILSVYRRMDKPGLWAVVSALDGHSWRNETQIPIWGYESGKIDSGGSQLLKNWTKLRFGTPHMIKMPDDDIYGVFWETDEAIGTVRYFRLTYNN